jgi:hypothetical protein
MKTLENKTIQIKGANPTTYSELLQVCLDVPPQGGFTTTEMKARLKVSTALDKANGHIELEDADYNKLVELVKDMKWGVVAQELVDMEEALLNAK